MKLKTTPEERAAARAQSSGIPGSSSTVAAHMADDIDTLLAEVERLRAEVKAADAAGYAEAINDAAEYMRYRDDTDHYTTGVYGLARDLEQGLAWDHKQATALETKP